MGRQVEEEAEASGAAGMGRGSIPGEGECADVRPCDGPEFEDRAVRIL